MSSPSSSSSSSWVHPNASQHTFLRTGMETTCPTTITSEDICGICLVSASTHPEGSQTKQHNYPPTITIRACGHFFHPDCLMQWLADHSTCPMCRAKQFVRKVCTMRLAVKVREEGEVVDYEFLTEAMRDRRLEVVEDEVERRHLVEAEWWEIWTECKDGEEFWYEG